VGVAVGVGDGSGVMEGVTVKVGEAVNVGAVVLVAVAVMVGAVVMVGCMVAVGGMVAVAVYMPVAVGVNVAILVGLITIDMPPNWIVASFGLRPRNCALMVGPNSIVPAVAAKPTITVANANSITAWPLASPENNLRIAGSPSINDVRAVRLYFRARLIL
jgi:hypothetical protein